MVAVVAAENPLLPTGSESGFADLRTAAVAVADTRLRTERAEHSDAEGGFESSDIATSSDDESEGERAWRQTDPSKYSHLRVHQVHACIRRDFVRKVYGIITVQLCVTCMIAAWLTSVFRHNPSVSSLMAIGANIALLVTVCSMRCFAQEGRTFPCNYILLAAITVLVSIIVSFLTSVYSTMSVFLALAATVVTFFGLTAYACCTKTDFTGLGPYLYGALLALITFGVCSIVFEIYSLPLPNWTTLLFAYIGVLVFSMYIIYDTQLILGGPNHKASFSVDDYTFAALHIYLDIINLFIRILAILGGRQN